jgi:hypothetical protein
MANNYDVVQQRMGEHMRKLFEILLPYPDGLLRDVAMARLVEAMPLSEHEAGHYYSSGRQRFATLFGWASASLVKAGWLSHDQLLWRVTPEGERAFREFTDPLVFIRTATRIRNARRKQQAAGVPARRTEAGPAPAQATIAQERKAVDAACSFDPRLRRCGDLFLLHPVMPLANGAGHAELHRRFQIENERHRGLDWEIEDFLSECPSGDFGGRLSRLDERGT